MEFVEDPILFGFVSFSCAGFDEGHSVAHAKKVATNVVKLAQMEKLNLDKSQMELLVWLGYCHDVNDHKYKHIAVGEEALEKEFAKKFGDEVGENAIVLFNNISWSKRDESVKMTGIWRTYQTLIQDADWLEALGEGGIKRCELYDPTRSTEGVVIHIYEKLFRLPDFLNTQSARQIAEGLMQPLYDYVAKYDADGAIKRKFVSMK